MRGRVYMKNMSMGIFFFALVLLVSACSQNAAHVGKIVFTVVPSAINPSEAGNFRYAEGLSIAISGLESPIDTREILTTDFASARGPEVSYDGRIMVFSAQKSAGDVWQIYTMNLDSKEVKAVTASSENCTDPVWLPDGRIAFSKLVADEVKSLKFHALFTIDPSGCCEQRITFQPHDDLGATVMNDGRLLFASRQLYPEVAGIKYLTMRPDGTKAQLFYLPDSTSAKLSKACESTDRKVLFVQSGNLQSVRFARPLHSLKEVSVPDAIAFESIRSMENGGFLAAVKKASSGLYAVAVLKDDNGITTIASHQTGDAHLLEPVMIEERSIPKKLPSLMDMEDPSGYIVGMNADESTIKISPDMKSITLQILGYDGILGETALEADGSFYIAVEADRPVRVQTVDGTGQIVRGPSSWIWVRPSERRACLGCHEDKETVPDNVVPKAIEKAPVAMIK